MNHLAISTLELTVDEPNYEKAQQIFKEYANQEVFKRRVVSGRQFNVLRYAKEMPKEINYNLLHKVSNVGKYYREFTEKAERKLFTKSL